MFKILIVEDSPEFQLIISRTLPDFHLCCRASAEEASLELQNEKFDLILLDINLPQRDGYSLLTEIQSKPATASIPVLCLTGRKEITDKVTAFSLGADDFITKPFDPIELRARVEAKLKKLTRAKNDEQITVIGEIEIDHSRHRVAIIEGERRREVQITQTEFKILCCLSRRPEQVYTRDQLLVAAWGEDARVLDRVVDAHVCLLRKKLGKYSSYIKAVSGLGYKLTPSTVQRTKKAV